MAGPIPTNFNLFISDLSTALGTVYLTDPLEAHWQAVATQIPITSSQFVDAWTGLMPKARVWQGDRVVNTPSLQTYTVIPKPFELTYSIDRFHLDDDIHDAYFRMVPDLVRQTRRWESYEIRDMLENTGNWTGTYQNGPDGLSFFNTAHQIDIYNSALGTYSNDFSGGAQNVTYTKANGGTVTVSTGGGLSPVAFKTLYEYMFTIKGEDNERIGVRADTLMHPVALKTDVEIIIKNAFFAPPNWNASGLTSQVGAAENPFRRFGIVPYMNEFLNDPQMWYLADTARSFKPIRWGLREAWRIVPRMNENDPVVFDTHNYLIGGWARGCPLWSYSFLMTRSGP
jgi:phage major head subunit gpT-like protein